MVVGEEHQQRRVTVISGSQMYTRHVKEATTLAKDFLYKKDQLTIYHV